MSGRSFKLLNSNFELHSPLSCRWRSDWLPCHHSQSIGGIRDRRFQFLLYRQTSGQECVLQRATSATGADMRRRPSLSIRWMPPCRRLFSIHFSVASTFANSKPDLTPTQSHAATVVNYSLGTSLSPPVQRDGMPESKRPDPFDFQIHSVAGSAALHSA